jgi:Pentapeptide repeats (8 copies)
MPIPRTSVNKLNSFAFIASASRFATLGAAQLPVKVRGEHEMRDSDPAGPRDKQESKKWVDKTWVQLIGVTVAIILFVLVAGLLLDWYVNPENSKAKRDLVQALALITAGVAGAFGIYFTWRGQRITREGLQLTRANLESTQKDTAEQLRLTQQELHLTQQGQITERFTQAIDQLGATDDDGNKLFEIRLGGIYALERIARESEVDYWPIMEVLTAYVRHHAHRRPGERQDSRKDAALEKNSEEVSDEAEPETAEVPTPDPAIQAIMTVLRRRTRSSGHGEPEPLDLHGAHLAKANLSKANLSKAHLREVHLWGAYVWEADLSKANLSKANLSSARLWTANLSGADLSGAGLSGADLPGADLMGADLSGAFLVETNLSRAKLIGAKLIGADLIVANLSRANLMSADLSGARLIDANLSGARLGQAKNLDQAEIDMALGDESTELPPNIERPTRWGVGTDEQVEED